MGFGKRRLQSGLTITMYRGTDDEDGDRKAASNRLDRRKSRDVPADVMEMRRRSTSTAGAVIELRKGERRALGVLATCWYGMRGDDGAASQRPSRDSPLSHRVILKMRTATVLRPI
ncbi:hypothetical protein BDN70DRAFT_898617 [Pholiota conissans]|uniref:Uncharacterized protein n=1 Tax=Pholiota conissans TaxID=109636 RepID=A0A9P5YS91_9AGAR|nr:hypothetical protein BDN70DRAFT_898617 [Pholiota conissans]